MIYFDRNFRPGVTLISYKGLCPKSPDASQIIFREWAVLEQVLLRKLRPEDAPALHRVQIPSAYMQRAARVYQRDHQANREVIQPLLNHIQPAHANRSVK